METRVLKKSFFERWNKEHPESRILSREGILIRELEKAVELLLDIETQFGTSQNTFLVLNENVMTAADIAVENEEIVNKRLGL